jgi:hypothetical protein
MEINIEPAMVWLCPYCGIRIYGITNHIIHSAIYMHLDQNHSKVEGIEPILDAQYNRIKQKTQELDPPPRYDDVYYQGLANMEERMEEEK